MVEEKIFGNNDKLIYVYDENDLVTEIQFQGAGSTATTRLEYQYDSFGRGGLVYHDLVNNIDEEYEYDLSGNLIKIISDEDDYIVYEYDTNGNLSIGDL
ncbi:MAG: hypothetical protein MZU97_14100 [Bacillus subtilis]|nr:hypothetical protein [Bacillus subtilis]